MPAPLMALAEKLGPCETCTSGDTMLLRRSSGYITWICLKCQATARVYPPQDAA
jgi:hypothetical protein